MSGIVSALCVPQVFAKDREPDLGARQRADHELRQIIDFVADGTLPEEEKRAREIALTKAQYEVVDGVLYCVQTDKSLRIVPPKGDRQKLFHDANNGVFRAHLTDAKVNGKLRKLYWWPGMRADIIRWCRGCLTCVTRQAGRSVKPPLTRLRTL